MLTRRHLRVKVLQALYAFYQTEKDLAKGEKELFYSLECIYDLYLLFLQAFPEINRQAINYMEEAKNKNLPTEEDLNPNTKFVDNFVFHAIMNDKKLEKLLNERKLNWGKEKEDAFFRVFKEIKNSDEYKKYMNNNNRNRKEDVNFAVKIFNEYMVNSDTLLYHLDEKSIYWMDDVDIVAVNVGRTIKELEKSDQLKLVPLYKDPKENIYFVKTLFRNAVMDKNRVENLIAETTKNWEIDRIALMDKLLISLAIAEVLYFPTIPVKVSINEFIDLSKFYSTPKSKNFINGVLDRIIEKLRENGEIEKRGRGLVEN